MDDHELARFLVAAKRATYAAGAAELDAPCRPSSKDLAWEEGRYRYLDSYFGARAFGGQEVVYRDEAPAWCMNYYGTTEVPDPGADINSCLREALRHLPAEAPYRGPARFVKGDLAYRCSWTGNLDRFTGEEWIERGDEVVYRLAFHGGAIE